VWIHRLTGYILIIGGVAVSTLCFIHFTGAELDTVFQSWFGFDIESNTTAYWLHANPGTAIIVGLFITILGSKLTTDSAPYISRITDEHMLIKSAEAARYALQDMMEHLAHSITETAKTADAGLQLRAHQQRLAGQIGQTLESIAKIDPNQAKALDPMQLVQIQGFVTYANHQFDLAKQETDEFATVLSDLETDIRLFEQTDVNSASRRAELSGRMEQAMRQAQQLLNLYGEDTKIVQLKQPAVE
jgi:hypothetical protein